MGFLQSEERVVPVHGTRSHLLLTATWTIARLLQNEHQTN